ncbi:hypothetical protein [Segatella bryantii]|uniref:hypothetical protein n=1 Tax=Segatella bryantii TaxID=77095 RepID=UPI001160016F|nr:hypothetical protein [Segatella bryantii]
MQTKSAASQRLQKSGGANLHQVCTYGLTTVLPPRLIFFVVCLRNVIFLASELVFEFRSDQEGEDEE